MAAKRDHVAVRRERRVHQHLLHLTFESCPANGASHDADERDADLHGGEKTIGKLASLSAVCAPLLPLSAC